MPAHEGLFSQLKPNTNFGTNEHYLLPYQTGWKLGWNILSK